MRNIKITFGYEGTAYCGFQSQPNGITVQDRLEEALRTLTGETVNVHASGRTDAGVHARAQVASFRTESRIPPERWALALNARLPDDIVVTQAEEVPESFHARFSAKRKTYRYSIDTGKHPDVFRRRTHIHHPRPLDVSAMREALAALVGEHDFTTFCSVKSVQASHVRTVFEAVIEEERGCPGNALHISVTGNGFLYNMVRIIVGTLLEVGEGKRPASNMARILAAKDRALAGPTAEAHGLTLWEVVYGEQIPLDSSPDLL